MSTLRAKNRDEVLESVGRTGRELTAVEVERKADAWTIIDAASALQAWSDGVDLRRWAHLPEVADAIREARAATQRAAWLAIQVATP